MRVCTLHDPRPCVLEEVDLCAPARVIYIIDIVRLATRRGAHAICTRATTRQAAGRERRSDQTVLRAASIDRKSPDMVEVVSHRSDTERIVRPSEYS